MTVYDSLLRRRVSTSMARARARGQSVVEFGLVALMFTLLLMGTVDFAVLLNGWLGVSSSARDIARQLAVGVCPPTTTTNFTTSVAYCASGGGGVPNGASPTGIQGVDPTTPVTVTVSICSTDASCSPPASGADLWNIYPGGTCEAVTITGCSPLIRPTANDAIVVTVVAQIQVVTPLVRPFFGCTNGRNPRCDVPITSRAVARYEGPYI